MRLFVALDLPEAVRQPLAAWRPAVPEARWVPAGRLHLTLRFLGETPADRLTAITDRMDDLRAVPVPLATGGLLRLPSARRPRALTVAVAEAPELAALADRLDALLDAAGAPARDRPLLPHVTLARFRRPDPAAVRKTLRGLDPPVATGLATSVSLVESLPSPEGPRYETRLRVPLAETGTGGGG